MRTAARPEVAEARAVGERLREDQRGLATLVQRWQHRSVRAVCVCVLCCVCVCVSYGVSVLGSEQLAVATR